MGLSTFIISVFCLIDDRIEELGRLRGRGPTPTLCDSEVLTIEVVGEFWASTRTRNSSSTSGVTTLNSSKLDASSNTSPATSLGDLFLRVVAGE